MLIKVTVTSNISNRSVEKSFTPKQLLNDYFDEFDLVEKITICDCQPVGETYVVDCNCDLEWEDYNIDFKEYS